MSQLHNAVGVGVAARWTHSVCAVWAFAAMAGVHSANAQFTAGEDADPTFRAVIQNIAPDGKPLTEVEIDPQLRELVQRLDDPSFNAREAAVQEIIKDADDRVQLYALLAKDELTVEQRYRLLGVLREYLLTMPRGAVGIRMENMLPGMAVPGAGVRVAELLPGLPAERVLEVGDRIMSIDGQPLTVTSDLQRHVQSKRPGQKITIVVKRSRIDERGDLVLDANNQPMTDELKFEIALGSSELLRNNPEAGNMRMPQTPIEQLRSQEAAMAATRYAPPPRGVTIKTVTGEDYSLSESSLSALIARGADPRIDAHPAIRTLIEDMLFVEQGLQTETPELRTWWNDTLESLQKNASQQVLDAESREYNRRVAERYSQLLRLRTQ